MPVLSSSDLDRCLQATATGGLVACSYDLATDPSNNSKLRAWMSSAVAALLILDEVHFCKSADAQRSHAVLGKDGIIHAAARTWALSGTPAPNNLAELFPLLRCFGEWRGSYDHYVSRFCKTRSTPFGPQIVGNQNIPEFRKLIAPIILRRKKEEVMKDLPPILFSDVTVPAGPVDTEICFPEFFIHKARIPDFQVALDTQRATMEAAVKMLGTGADGMKLLEAFNEGKVSTLRRYVGLQKCHPVIDMVKDELNSGLDKIVLFAVHRDVIETLRQGLAKFGAVTLYGGTDPARRQRNVDKFARDPKCRVFIGNIQAAGVGIDGLQNQCAAVMFVEQDWVPGHNAQAAMRVHRIGQTRPVNVRVALLDGDELDRRIQFALRRKTKDLVAAFD
jgi:SWI/SNF-related matrix-associated actin-dependent regulator 1 of chromatin subfamily A